MAKRDVSSPARPVRVRGHRDALHPQGDAVTRRRAGQARTRGKLDAPQGRFALRQGLTSPGEMALADALVLVDADWDRQLAVGTISDDVIRCYKRDCRSLAKYAAKRFGRVLVRDLAVNDLVVWMATPKPDGLQVTNNSRRGASVRGEGVLQDMRVHGDLRPEPCRVDRRDRASGPIGVRPVR